VIIIDSRSNSLLSMEEFKIGIGEIWTVVVSIALTLMIVGSGVLDFISSLVVQVRSKSVFITIIIN
jgi:hypothetical protein